MQTKPVIFKVIIERRGTQQVARYVRQVQRAEQPQAKPKILTVIKQGGRTVLSMQSVCNW